MTRSRSVVISLPARDEVDAIERCLSSISATVQHARRLGVIDRAVVVVAAHRCVDNTAAVAARLLRRAGLVGEVVIDNESATIGLVRDRAARHGLARLGDGPCPGQRWVLSTDADTVVGEDWIARIFDVAVRRGAACVVGVADLDAWRGSAEGLAAYDDLLLSKYRDREFGDEHDHVYGANLAIRADAYLAVGGFPHTPHGEDQQLVDTVASVGYRVARTRAISVTTSGRTVGRADDGLADLLWRLDQPVRTQQRSVAQAGGAYAGTAQPTTAQPNTADPGADPYGLEDAANVRR